MLASRMNFNRNAVLTVDNLRALVPSAFAESAYHGTSKRYTYIPTSEVIEGLISEGFEPVRASESRTRIADKEGFTKHMIRFRHQSTDMNSLKLNEVHPELILINSHDGKSAYQLIAGLFRLVCLNGMIAGKNYDEIRVRHSGNVTNEVIEGSYRIIDQSKELLESADNMHRIELNPDERRIFAESVHSLRFNEDDEQGKSVKPEQFLRVKRHADTGQDLWTTLNVAQENLIKGGLSAWGRDKQGYARRTTTREVKSIDKNTSLNRAIWTLAEKMAELKS